MPTGRDLNQSVDLHVVIGAALVSAALRNRVVDVDHETAPA